MKFNEFYNGLTDDQKNAVNSQIMQELEKSQKTNKLLMVVCAFLVFKLVTQKKDK